MSFNLLVESIDRSNFNYIVEEGNKDQPSRVYIEGPYMVAEKINKNKRYYVKEEMEQEVGRYTTEMIEQQRAMGELNHPSTAEVDLERACHIVMELKSNGNEYIGKSKVLSTPCGKIVENLIRDGVKVGMSTRSLGKLHQETGGINRVQDMKLVAIDCVADPSYTGAFVVEKKIHLPVLSFLMKTAPGVAEVALVRFQRAIFDLLKIVAATGAPAQPVGHFCHKQLWSFGVFHLPQLHSSPPSARCKQGT